MRLIVLLLAATVAAQEPAKNVGACIPDMTTSTLGETAVAREKRSSEHFGERDIDGIIGREVVP